MDQNELQPSGDDVLGDREEVRRTWTLGMAIGLNATNNQEISNFLTEKRRKKPKDCSKI